MTANVGNILQFSGELCEALKVDIPTLKESYSDIQWQTPNFVIMMSNHLMSDGWLHFEWHTILEAFPKPPGKTGLIDPNEAVKYIPVGIGWEYHSEGQSRPGLPYEEYRKIILDEIRGQQAIKAILSFKDGDTYIEGVDDLIKDLPNEQIENRFDILDL